MQSNINFRIDSDSSLSFEPTNFFGNLFNRFILIPFFTIFPRGSGVYLFTKSSKSANEIYQFAKTSRALEVLYSFDGKVKITGNFLDDLFSYFYQHNFKNAKAVRNRFKLVRRELKLAIREIYNKKGATVNIFSLASGSARVVIEVMSELKKEGIKVDAKLLDLSKDAIELSKKIALEFGVYGQIIWCNDKVSNFTEYCKDWKPDVVEMVGFLDYLNQEKAIALSSKIYSMLPSGGVFITCNIRDNYERKFVSKILNWDMIYRDENELADVLTNGGFLSQNIKIIYEPYLIHGLAIGKK